MAFKSQGQAPEISNTDQGRQFTSEEWTHALLERGVQISRDGRGRWMDNVFIERLWRSVKYEDNYLKEYATVEALGHGLRRWFEHYNHWRPHQALGNQTPAVAHGACLGNKPVKLPTQHVQKMAA